MRWVLPFLLLPAFATAQDVPSLQRPLPALPISTSPEVLDARLGKPGGPFAAAQLALIGPEGRRRLLAALNDVAPLRRLDAVFGLEGLDDPEALRAVARSMGDPDPQASGEAYSGLRRLGARATTILEWAVYRGNEGAGASALYLLFLLDHNESEAVARTPGAGGRAAAIDMLPRDAAHLKVVEAALDDSRPRVTSAAVHWIVSQNVSPERDAAVARLVHSPREAVRLELAQFGDERPEGNLMIALATDPSPRVRQAEADTVVRNLYDRTPPPAQLLALGHLVSDRNRSVSDLALDRLYAYVSDRLNNDPSIDWSRFPDWTTRRLRQGLAAQLRGVMDYKAAVALSILRDRRAYPLLAPLAFEPSNPNRDVALRALGYTGDRRATHRLLALVGDPRVGEVAVAALGHLRDPAAIPVLLSLVRRDPQNRGLAAATSLGQIGDRRAAGPLLALVRSMGDGWDANYFPALGALGGPAIRDYLLERLDHDLETTAELAANAIVSLKDPSIRPELERIAAGKGRRAEAAKRALAALRNA